MFWKKKEKELKSNEYEELSKKITSIVADIDIINNRITIITESVKSNRANIGVLKRREHEEEESEKPKKDNAVYL